MKKIIVITLLAFAPIITFAQASGGQIIRKSHTTKPVSSNVKRKQNTPSNAKKDGTAELEKIRKQGEDQERIIQDELLRTNDNNKKFEILKKASKTFKGAGDFERAIKYYNQYLSILPRVTFDDLYDLAEIYSRFADKMYDYDLVDYRKEILLKADETYEKMAQISPANELYATYQRANIQNKLDPDFKFGLAKPYHEKVIRIVNGKTNKTQSDMVMLKYSLHYMMARAIIVEGDKATAKNYANEILKIDPSFTPAIQIRDM